MIGGWGETQLNDIWSSDDAINWVKESSNADFSERSGHQVVLFKDKLWLIGGWDRAATNDIWSSDNGNRQRQF